MHVTLPKFDLPSLREQKSEKTVTLFASWKIQVGVETHSGMSFTVGPDGAEDTEPTMARATLLCQMRR